MIRLLVSAALVACDPSEPSSCENVSVHVLCALTSCFQG